MLERGRYVHSPQKSPGRQTLIFCTLTFLLNNEMEFQWGHKLVKGRAEIQSQDYVIIKSRS